MNIYDQKNGEIAKSVSASALEEDCEGMSNLKIAAMMDHVRALEAEKFRLRSLVCHLLCKNEQLRNEIRGAGNTSMGASA